MKLSIKDTKKPLTATDLLVVFGFEDAKNILPAGVEVPALALKSFRGETRETRLTDANSGPAKRVLQIGLGKKADLNAEGLRRAAAIAVKKAEKVRAASLTIWTDANLEQAAGDTQCLGQPLAEGAEMGSFAFHALKHDAPTIYLKKVALCGAGAPFKKSAERGAAIGAANCFTRVLQDKPGNLMRPCDMVAEAKQLSAASPQISLKILDEKAMEKLGMGSLLSVSRGSSEPAYLIHLVYKPKKKASGRLCFVGKGLTFDAGGISLKPASKMDEMKYDMSGGAAVLGIFHALAKLNPGVEIHGVVPTSENMPDGMANKPGDIVTSMNGLTIEVLNTDAEGRLILCDALTYAEKRIKPDTMIDMATLTGAVVVALGHELTGSMGNDDSLQIELAAAGKESGEAVWPLPILDCHKRQLKGAFGDLRNMNSGQGAGSSVAGAFLSKFVGDVRWAHLDIAGAAWGCEDRDYQGGPRGTGVGVRLLLQWVASNYK
jgi:leucyl aminopeptidase